MVQIRHAHAGDAAALAALKLASFRQTFLEGFGIPYPPADLAVFEEQSYSVDAVLAELGDPERQNWIAEDQDGRLLGYAQVGPCKLPHPEVQPGQGELYQLYVLREAQGQKLGKQLLEVAMEHLAHSRPGPIWLGVWSGNDKAQAVYAAKGFEKVGDYRFKVGSWYDEEYILRRS